MKKKLIISVALVVAILLVLFVPHRRDGLNDGGTVIYDALAYRVVSWNVMYGNGNGAYKSTSVYWFPDNMRDVGDLWQLELSDKLETTVSRVGYIEGYEIWLGALNREKMSINSVQHLPIFKFDTLDEFDGFTGAKGKEFCGVVYDSTFFDENTLLLVYVPATSGSYRYDVHSVYHKGNAFCVHVEQTNSPKVATDDMTGWFITLAVPDGLINDYTVFDADLGNFTMPN